jgi:hypothetical protein
VVVTLAGEFSHSECSIYSSSPDCHSPPVEGGTAICAELSVHRYTIDAHRCAYKRWSPVSIIHKNMSKTQGSCFLETKANLINGSPVLFPMLCCKEAHKAEIIRLALSFQMMLRVERIYSVVINGMSWSKLVIFREWSSARCSANLSARSWG